MVILNKIYTRTGDAGTTALGNGERVGKASLRISCYGTVDETNSAIGMARAHLATMTADGPADPLAAALNSKLARVQNDLFDLGADLCVPDRGAPLDYEPLRTSEAQVKWLEDEIDAMNAKMAPLRQSRPSA